MKTFILLLFFIVLGISIKSQSKTENTFNELIAHADSAYTLQDYDNAIMYYVRASNLDTNSVYPKDKIVGAKTLKGYMIQIETKYLELIDLGNNQFDLEDYINSKESFRKALAIIPTKTYPKKMIEIIDQIIIKR